LTHQHPRWVRLADLGYLLGKLDECQRGLADYLEAKRMAFPRFYFLSDDDLLGILGSSEPRPGGGGHQTPKIVTFI